MSRAHNGEGSFRKTSKAGEPEKWTGRKQFGINSNGKPNIKAVYGNSEREVRRKMKEYEKTLASEKDSHDMNKEVLIEYLYRWFETFKKPTIKKRTYDGLKDLIRLRIEPYSIAHMQMNQINSSDLQAYINSLAYDKRIHEGKVYAPYSRDSISKTYYLINSCLQYAENNYDISRNPMRAVNVPKEENIITKTKDIAFFDYNEMKSIYAEATRKFKNGKYVYSKNGLAISLLLFTGLRIGEAIALKYEDYDKENRIIHVRHSISRVKDDDGEYMNDLSTPKSKKSIRDLNVSETVDFIISEFGRLSPRHSDSDFILTSGSGGSMFPRNIRRTLNSIQETVGTKEQNSGLHTLRHSFCSYLIMEKHVPIEIVSAIMGHADVSVTQRVYLHITDNSKKNVLNVFDDDF